jgi:hypothetical protein
MGQWKYLALAALFSGCTSQPAKIESFQCAEGVSPKECRIECLRHFTTEDPDFQRYDANGWLVAVKMTEEDRWLWAFTPASHPRRDSPLPVLASNRVPDRDRRALRV